MVVVQRRRRDADYVRFAPVSEYAVACEVFEQGSAAFASARAAQPAWAELGASERGRRLLAFHDLLLAAQAELADVIVAESGKARKDAVE